MLHWPGGNRVDAPSGRCGGLRRGRLVTDPEEKILALRTITEHLVPGQWSYARQPSKKELAATSALAVPLTESSVKIRAGGPSDEPEDHALDIWAGVVPVTTGFGEPEPDAVLRSGIETPPHIIKRDELPRLSRRQRTIPEAIGCERE